MALVVSSMYVGGSTMMHSQNTNKYISTPVNAVGYSTSTHQRILNSRDVEKYVQEAYADDPILVDIARCESTFRQFDADGSIIRGLVNSEDVGVMQINEKYHAQKAVSLGHNIYTMEGNLAYAKYLYDTYGAQPWKSSSKCWSQSNIVASL